MSNRSAAAAIVAMAITALIVAGYVLAHQRLVFPWEDRYTLYAEFTTAQAVTPGQGQAVNVAGVKVGQIRTVRLRDGRAVVEMGIDPAKLPRVHADARALLRPRTGLNDMMIELDPGTPSAPAVRDGGSLPIAATAPPVNLDEVLAALDADTRQWLQLLLHGAGEGLRGRGDDLSAVLRAGAPTARSLRRVTDALADRREQMRRLVGNLSALAQAAGRKDRELGRLVAGSQTVLGALASQEEALRASLERLPPTLRAARGTLEGTAAFADAVGPGLRELRPAVRALPPALRAAHPLLREGTPVLRRDLRPLVRAAAPVARDLRPATRDLAAVTPRLISAFHVLTYVVNELGHNPPGPEEGFLFWTAWFAHNAASLLSIEDAHGASWRGQVIMNCSSLALIPRHAPQLEPFVNPDNPACADEP